MQKRSHPYILGAALLTALALRLMFVTQRVELEEWDSAVYVELAESLVAGNGFRMHPTAPPHVWFQPGYPMLIAAVASVTGDVEQAGYLVAAIFGSLVLVPLFLIARQVYSPATALIAVGLAVFHYRMIDASSLVLTEMPYTFFWLFALYALLRIVERGSEYRTRRYLLFGASLGVAALLRTEGALYFGFLTGLLVLFELWRAHRVRTLQWERLRGLGIAAAVFGVFLLPYSYYLYRELGQFAITGRTHRTVFAVLEASEETYKVYAGSPFAFVLADPVYALKRIVKNVSLMVREHSVWAFPPVVVGLMMLGLFAEKWSARRARSEAFLACAFLFPWLTYYGITGIRPRYYYAFVALGLVWAARGVEAIVDCLRTSDFGLAVDSPLLRRSVLSLAVLAVVLLSFAQELTFPFRNGGYPLHAMQSNDRQVAKWLASNVAPYSKVLAASPRITYHSNTEYADYRDGTSLTRDNLLEFLERERIDYVVADKFLAKQLYPNLAFLLEPKQAPWFLTPIASIEFGLSRSGSEVAQVFRFAPRAAESSRQAQGPRGMPGLATRAQQDAR